MYAMDGLNQCCVDCFADEILKEFVKEKKNKIKECSFCQSTNVYGRAVEDLKDILSPLIYLYTPVTNFYPLEYLKEMDLSDSMIWNKLTDDWQVFDNPFVGQEIITSIFEDDPRDGTFYGFNSDAVDIEDDWYGHETEYSTSKSWDRFCREIKFENRFFPRSFNSEIVELIVRANQRFLKSGTYFYRARINETGKTFRKSEMGSPPSERARFGRMNPQGISYLYLSSDDKTCVAEVKPNITDTLSIGKFKIIKDLNLVDVLNPFIGSPFKYGEDLAHIYRAKDFLKSLGNTLALPVDPQQSYLEYLPSQFVCEFIKHLGFDGLTYKSTLTKGLNYLLFDESKIKCTKVIQVKDVSISYDFK